MEQRTDETARRPGAAAEDTGPPGDKQSGTTPAAGETTAETNGDPAVDREPGWEPQGRRGPSFTPATPGSFGSSSAEPPGKSGSSSASGRPSSTYPSGRAYSGNNVDDGYGPPGGERPATDFPSSSVASQTFGAAPAESVYGSSGQRDYSPSPYPSQVTASRPQAEDPRSRTATPAGPASSAPSPAPSAPSAPSAAEATRTDRPSAWQAATSRMPRPQQVTKKPKPNKRKGDGTSARQAHLMVSRFEPWSVMKFSFMISLACFVILFVAVALLYGTLAGLGVFDAIQKALSNVTSGQGTGGVSISKYLSASTILSYTALLGVLNVFLITAFATVGSLVYNLTAHLIGGVEVTLQETE